MPRARGGAPLSFAVKALPVTTGLGLDDEAIYWAHLLVRSKSSIGTSAYTFSVLWVSSTSTAWRSHGYSSEIILCYKRRTYGQLDLDPPERSDGLTGHSVYRVGTCAPYAVRNAPCRRRTQPVSVTPI
ncbi:hypothetical protein EDB89DRAFT_1948535 [Lactarius sanguifluus]|nr:hypothetical protein EDB89DRAFT_1948535 [Lactarius sanguifluus]